MREIDLPISNETVRSLKVGDSVVLNGVMVTGRDAVHKWLVDTFIRKISPPQDNDLAVYQAIRPLLAGSMIYHCGPVVAGLEDGKYRFVAAGPTTSIREEPYQGEVLRHFHLKGVIGKGGMGPQTLAACQEEPGVYLHAIGGAASLIAQRVVRVLGVHKLEFGPPEAMWVIEIRQFPAVVTMDSHGGSLHAQIEQASQQALKKLLELSTTQL